ncbi:MAG: GtrA family protein [Pseudoxanthomonas sp.]
MQLLRFLVVGVLNTGLGLVCIYAAMWLQLDYRVSNGIGYAVGISVSFVLNRNWTFRHRGDWQNSLGRWLGVTALAYSLNILVLIGLHQRLGVNAYAAQLGGAVTYTLAAFMGGRYFAFQMLPPAMSKDA